MFEVWEQEIALSPRWDSVQLPPHKILLSPLFFCQSQNGQGVSKVLEQIFVTFLENLQKVTWHLTLNFHIYDTYWCLVENLVLRPSYIYMH